MAKTAIKPKKEPTDVGSAETANQQLTPAQDVKLEVVKTPTLEELESAVEAALISYRESGWAFAVAVTAIHDSGLYEYTGEPNGFFSEVKNYLLTRCGSFFSVMLEDSLRGG